jgi:hypothetical protein
MRTAGIRKTDMRDRVVQVQSARLIRGSTLIDELTAVVVLSVGLLGLTALQGRLIRTASDAESELSALSLAQSRFEQLRGFLHETGAVKSYQSITSGVETMSPAGAQPFSTRYTMQVEVTRFRLEKDVAGRHFAPIANDSSIPVSVIVPEFKRVTITVSWSDRLGEFRSVDMAGIIGSVAPTAAANMIVSPGKIPGIMSNPVPDTHSATARRHNDRIRPGGAG